ALPRRLEIAKASCRVRGFVRTGRKDEGGVSWAAPSGRRDGCPVRYLCKRPQCCNRNPPGASNCEAPHEAAPGGNNPVPGAAIAGGAKLVEVASEAAPGVSY